MGRKITKMQKFIKNTIDTNNQIGHETIGHINKSIKIVHIGKT